MRPLPRVGFRFSALPVACVGMLLGAGLLDAAPLQGQPSPSGASIAPHADDPGEILGHVLDAGTEVGVAGAEVAIRVPGEEEPLERQLADPSGEFRFQDVPAGVYRIEVSHLAYGEQADSIEVEAGQRHEVELLVSQEAIELETLSVAGAAERPEPRTDAAGFNHISREQIESMDQGGNTLADAMQRFFPGASVRTGPRGETCVEFRGGRRAGGGGCNNPMVILDGNPLTGAGHLFRTLPLRELEEVEFIPANRATARYGDDASYGALVINTLRFHTTDRAPDRGDGDRPDRPPEADRGVPGFSTYDWAEETGTHSWARTFFGSMAGTALGMGAAAAAHECFSLSEGVRTDCDARSEGLATGIGLPIAGATAGAQIFGTTAQSRGRVLPTVLGAVIPVGVGLAFMHHGDQVDVGDARVVGGALVVVGTPALSAILDGVFRSRRGESDPPDGIPPQR